MEYVGRKLMVTGVVAKRIAFDAFEESEEVEVDEEEEPQVYGARSIDTKSADKEEEEGDEADSDDADDDETQPWPLESHAGRYRSFPGAEVNAYLAPGEKRLPASLTIVEAFEALGVRPRFFFSRCVH